MTTTNPQTAETAQPRARPRGFTPESIRELMAKPALTLKECGRILDVSPDLLLKLIHSGQGPASFKIGRVTYVRTDTLRTWLRQLETEASSLGTLPGDDSPATPT